MTPSDTFCHSSPSVNASPHHLTRGEMQKGNGCCLVFLLGGAALCACGNSAAQDAASDAALIDLDASSAGDTVKRGDARADALPRDGGGSARQDGGPVGDAATGPDAGALQGSEAGTPPADATAGDVIDAAQNDPVIAALSGLVLWLDAAKGATYGAIDGGTALQGWADQSSAHNDMKTAFPDSVPTLTTTATFHGHAAFQFDSEEFWVDGAAGGSLDFGTDDLFVAVVGAFSNSTDTRGTFFADSVFGLEGAGFLFRGNGLSGADNTNGLELLGAPLTEDGEYTTDVDVTAPYNDGVARVYCAQRVSGTATVRVGGSVVGTQSGNANAAISGDSILEIGTYLNTSLGSDVLEGSIAEVLVIRGVLADADRGAVETYLMSKYGL